MVGRRGSLRKTQWLCGTAKKPRPNSPPSRMAGKPISRGNHSRAGDSAGRVQAKILSMAEQYRDVRRPNFANAPHARAFRFRGSSRIGSGAVQAVQEDVTLTPRSLKALGVGCTRSEAGRGADSLEWACTVSGIASYRPRARCCLRCRARRLSLAGFGKNDCAKPLSV